MSENYDNEKILNSIIFAIRKKDIGELQKIQGFLKQNNIEGTLLGLAPEDYEEYHLLLAKTSIKEEVKERRFDDEER